MKRGLSLVPLSPSFDPVSLAFDAASILGPLIKGFIGTGHLEANQIVPVQNEFHYEVLAPVVDAKDNPDTSIDDLLFWLDTLQREGEAFYQFTQKFPQAGPGARLKIFGIEDAGGNWIATAQNGIATVIMQDLERIISERTGDPMYSQLGIDWGRLIQGGVAAAAAITGQPISVSGGGQIITGTPPSQRTTGYTPQIGTSGIPEWVWPVGIAALALVLLTRGKK